MNWRILTILVLAAMLIGSLLVSSADTQKSRPSQIITLEQAVGQQPNSPTTDQALAKSRSRTDQTVAASRPRASPSGTAANYTLNHSRQVLGETDGVNVDLPQIQTILEAR